MKKMYVCLSFLLLLSLHAENEAGVSSPQHSDDSFSNNSSQPKDSESIIDRVIEAIAEAAVSNRDFGKDISDR